MSTVGKTISCKAAVVWDFKKDVSIETIEVAPPNPDEVRVKILYSGLCHSDLYVLDGNFPSQPLPLVLGHEGAGIVESVGNKVTTVKPGDKVFTLCLPHCRQCKACKGKRSNACDDIHKLPSTGLLGRTTSTSGKPSFFCKGKPLYHYVGASSLSEYTVISENSCVLINPNAPLETACLLACGFTTGYGTSANGVDIVPGDTTAVWGLGGVGLATVVGCKDKGAKRIIGIDVTNEKETIARKLGVTDYISLNSLKKPLLDTLLEVNGGVGLDFTFVCIGNIQAMITFLRETNNFITKSRVLFMKNVGKVDPSMIFTYLARDFAEVAVEALVEGGTMVIVGVAPETATMKVKPSFMLTSRKVIGCAIGDYKVRDDIPKLVDRYLQGTLPLEDFITHRFPLAELNEAIRVMRAGQSIRSVIKISS